MKVKTTRKCRDCGAEFIAYTSLDKFCYNCSIKNKKPLKSKNIKFSTKNKSKKIKSGQIRGVDNLTKAKVIARDNGKCVICGTSKGLSLVPHHVFYGGHKKHDGSDNTEKNLVTICNHDHYIIHHGTEKSQGHRKICEEYITNLYNNEKH